MANLFDKIISGANYFRTGQFGSDIFDIQQQAQEKQGSVIQGFLNTSKDKPEMQSKRNAVIQMLQNGEDDDFIENAITQKMGYNPSVTLKERVGSAIGQRFTTAGESLQTDKTGFEKALSAGKDVISLPFDVLGATAQPVIQPVVEGAMKIPGVEPTAQFVGEKYGEFRKENPRLAQNLEAVGGIGSAALPFTKTGRAVIKAPATLTKDAIVGATKIPGKVTETMKGLFPSAEQKLVKKLGQETAPGVIAGKKVKVPVPERGIIDKATFGIGRPKDPKVLAGRALTPTYAGKTPKQILSTVGDVEKNVKELYDKVRTGVYKGDLSTLESAANSVVQNLDEIGGKIGSSVKEAKGKIPLSKNRIEIARVLKDPIEKRAGAYNVLKKFYQDTAPIDGLSIQRAFKAKKIYQAEIKKLIKAGDAGTDSYETLVKGVQELNDAIDNAVANTPGFKDLKSQYAHLKKLVTDISKSAAVEGRRSPQTFVEQLGMVETLMEAASSPLSTAGKLFAKEIGELNTRGGAWKELMKIYDEGAIKAGKGMLRKSKPKVIK